jgi:hypothetical protein
MAIECFLSFDFDKFRQGRNHGLRRLDKASDFNRRMAPGS